MVKTKEGKRILLIDDDPVVEALMEQYLLSLGHQLYSEKHGAKGLSRAKEIQPDVIFLDLIMPDKSGFEVLKELQSDSETDAIPVIMITANPNTSAMAEVYGVDPHHYLTKPFDMASVNSALAVIASFIK